MLLGEQSFAFPLHSECDSFVIILYQLSQAPSPYTSTELGKLVLEFCYLCLKKIKLTFKQ